MVIDEISDYDFNLPDELIALQPENPRSSSKLLVYSQGHIVDSKFDQLIEHLRPNDRLIFNDTKVINGRLFGYRSRSTKTGTGIAKIEILLVERVSFNKWEALCKPFKRLKDHEKIVISKSLSAEVVSRIEDRFILQFSESGAKLDREISILGQLPLPPYILKKRPYEDSDTINYQSVFAQNKGAIASPTASLHFEHKLLNKLAEAGIAFSYLTLHVGAGTFLPIKAKNISEHKMHFERGKISENTANEINSTKNQGGRIITVGTTSLRLIESATRFDGIVEAYDSRTNIFIKPGYKFKCADGLITNFHFPKSTLLMLISAFVGNSKRKQIYNHALENKYRFFSYGDSSLLIPKL